MTGLEHFLKLERPQLSPLDYIAAMKKSGQDGIYFVCLQLVTFCGVAFLCSRLSIYLETAYRWMIVISLNTPVNMHCCWDSTRANISPYQFYVPACRPA